MNLGWQEPIEGLGCYSFLLKIFIMKIIELYRRSYSGLAPQVWLLALITLINRTGSMVLPFLSIFLSAEKGYSLSMTGLIMTAFGVGSFFGNWIGGVLADKMGPFRLQFWSLVLSAFCYISLMWLEGPWLFALGLFVTSLVAEAFRPANMASIALLAKPENRSKAVGLIRLAVNLGFGLGPAVGGFLANNYGYDWLFIIDGSTCFLAGICFLLFFSKHFSGEGKRVRQAVSELTEKPHLRQVLKDKLFVFFLVLKFLYGLVFMQYFHSVPVYFKKGLGLEEDYIGILMAVNGLLIALVEMPLIYLLERKGLMRMIALGTAIVSLCFMVLLFGPWVGWAWVSLLLFTFGEIFSLPFCTTVVMNRSPDHLRGRYMALYGMAFSLCHILAPLMGLGLADIIGFSGLWILLTVLMLATAYGFYLLKGRMHQEDALKV